MPNHVTNKVKLKGEQSRINELLEEVKYDDGAIGTLDFNKLIPMPESLNLTAGSIETEAINCFLSASNPDNLAFESIKKPDRDQFEQLVSLLNKSRSFWEYKTDLTPKEISEKYLKYHKEKTIDDLVELGSHYVNNFVQYGVTTWYDFCIREWGSKWNSYDEQPFEDNTLTFDTAWSRVMPVISKLSEKYSDIEIEYKWADEDLGVNVGVAKILNGQLIEEYLPEQQSKEAYELAAEIKEVDLAKDYGLLYNENSGHYEYCPEQFEDMGMEVT